MSTKFVALFAAALLIVGSFGTPLASGEGIEVFYLGTPDCPYCRQCETRHYPAQYKWVYELVGDSRGVPRFLLARRSPEKA